jgi:hypothetical protein
MKLVTHDGLHYLFIYDKHNSRTLICTSFYSINYLNVTDAVSLIDSFRETILQYLV